MTELIPSQPGLPVIGNLLDLRDKDGVPIRALENLLSTYGPILKLRLRGQERIFIGSQDLFEEVCDETRFWKVPVAALRESKQKASGLFTALNETEPDWQQAHRTLLPAFGPLAIHGMFDEMHDIASQLILKWARKGMDYRIPVTDDFTRLTLDTIALCAMDFRFNSFYQEEMHPFVTAMNNTLGQSGQPSFLPLFVQKFFPGSRPDVAADREYMRKVADDLVQERRKNPTEKKDLLNAMVNGKDPKTGEHMRDDLITANMTTFLIAGHETTSGLLSFAFFELLKNPAAYSAAREEVDKVIGGNRLTPDHLKDLKYLNAVLRETLRLHPTAPAFARQIRPENTEGIPTLGRGQYAINREIQVVCLLAKIQRDPKVYGEDAEEFKPERMLDENFNKLPKSAWKPFGTGVRSCIGRAFAWQEALMVTALLLQNFNFRLDDAAYELRIKQALTIKPRDLYMRASLREGITATTLQESLTTSNGKVARGDKNAIKSGSSGPESSGPPAIMILYGSNTGTCQTFAERLASAAKAHGHTASVADLDTAVEKIPKDQLTVIITASYEGEPPDNAIHFVRWLTSMKENSLTGAKFAVFGCGHSDWSSTFQRIPNLIDNTLGERGAERLVQKGFTDAAQGDMFSDFEKWEENTFWPAVNAHLGGKKQAAETKSILVQPTVKAEISTEDRASNLRQDVCLATVLDTKALTVPSVPEKRHLKVKLPSDMVYETGDYLVVLPLNPDDTVKRVMNHFHLPWDASIVIKDGGPTTLPVNTPMSVSTMLAGYVELAQPATKKDLRTCRDLTTNPSEKAALDLFLQDDQYHTDILHKRTCLFDILSRYKSTSLPFTEFLSLLPPMRLRHYSISSSPLADPTSCTITYSVIDSPSLSEPEGDTHFLGVAGTYLRSLTEGSPVQVSVRRSPPSKGFHLPLDVAQTPLLMFCAGAGLAPMRGFCEERVTQIRAGRSLAPAMLFVGCRSETQDRLYAEEMDEWAKSGAVSVRYAFSQEPEKSEGCKYVQDRMGKDWEEIIEMWENGAKAFVCGSRRLAEEVGKKARGLVKKIAEEKGLGGEDLDGKVEEWFAERRGQRFSTDVFG